jgi:hypothetical protein
MFRFVVVCAFAAAVSLPSGVVASQRALNSRAVLEGKLVSKPFKIDGHLEDAWSSAARFENSAEFMPTHKVPAKVQTEGFIAHGKTDLYVAFVCHDPEIGKLRASMTDRDWF